MHLVITKADFLCSYKVTDDEKLYGINVVKFKKFTKFQYKIQISLQSIKILNYYKHQVRWKQWVVCQPNFWNLIFLSNRYHKDLEI